jgi:hypothetical protein
MYARHEMPASMSVAGHDIPRDFAICWFEEVNEIVLGGVMISASSSRGGSHRDVIWLDKELDNQLSKILGQHIPVRLRGRCFDMISKTRKWRTVV